MQELIDNKEDEIGQTSLFFAIRSSPTGFPEIIELLIKYECNVNIRDKKGKSAVHYASELG